MSSLLFTKHPIVVSQELAGALTELDPQKKPRISEAAVLQQINYWLQKKQNYHECHYWVYNSLEEWTKQFTWIKTAKTMKRQFDWLEERGIVITGNYNKLKFDRTKWYTIDYDTLDRLVSPFARNDQMEIVDTTKREWSSQLNGNGRDDYDNTIDYTKTTTKSTTNKQANAVSADADLSESFNELWNLYPKKQGKKDAFRHYKAWRKKSKDNTDDYLLRKLNEYKTYLAANQWLHPMNGSTWFNGRFDDDYSTANSQGYQPLQQPQGDVGFAQKLVDGKWTQNEINVAVKGIKNLSPQQKAYYVQPIDQEGNTRYRLDYLAGKAIPISDALDRL